LKEKYDKKLYKKPTNRIVIKIATLKFNNAPTKISMIKTKIMQIESTAFYFVKNWHFLSCLCSFSWRWLMPFSLTNSPKKHIEGPNQAKSLYQTHKQVPQS
jgi:hypothetical protein